MRTYAFSYIHYVTFIKASHGISRFIDGTMAGTDER